MLRSTVRMRPVVVALALAVATSSVRSQDDSVQKELLAVYQKAEALKKEGKYPEAARAYERAVELAPVVHGASSPEAATLMNNLAELYRSMGRYTKAESLYERSLQIREAKLGKDHPHVASSLNNLALLYLSLGQYAKAEPLFQRSLQIREERLGEDHPDVANGLNNLAGLYMEMGQYAKAEPLFQRSLQIWENKLGKDHPNVASSLNNLAGLYMEMGQYAKAEPLLQRGLQIRENKLGKDHPDLANGLHDLAILYQDMGHYAKAEPLYQRALDITRARLGQFHPSYFTRQQSYAAFLAKQGRTSEAIRIQDAALKHQRQHTVQVLPILSETEQMSFLRAQRRRQDLALSLVLSTKLSEDNANRSASWLINSKAASQQAISERYLLARDADTEQARQTLQQLNDVRQQMARLTTGASTSSSIDVRKRLEELAQQEQKLAAQLSESNQLSFRDDPWIDCDEVARRLPASAAFIDLVRFQRHSFDPKDKSKPVAHYAAWITPRNAEVQVVDLGDANSIDTLVGEMRKALQASGQKLLQSGEPEAEEAVRKTLRKLSTRLLEPLRKYIDGAEHWVFSPDGNLWLVPWAALLVDNATYAIEKHSIRLVVSGRDLILNPLQLDRRTTAPVLLVAPDFDGSPSQTATSTRGLGDATPDLSGLTLEGSIEDWKVTFKLRADGQLFIHDAENNELAGQGTWEQQGKKLRMQTKISCFEGQIEGQTLSGIRRKEEEDGNESSVRWSARLPEDARRSPLASTRGISAAPSIQLELAPVQRLPGTAKEAALIAPQLFKLTGSKPAVYTGDQASEGQLKTVQRPRLLMVSTYGFFLPDQEVQPRETAAALSESQPAPHRADQSGHKLEYPLLRCGLLLAGCNQRQKAGSRDEDGVLTGLEILSLDLRGTEMVVLSACETGLGKANVGESVAGLRQAFQLAGAQSVLATLWQIPDHETVQLMSRFSEELAKGKEKAEALRQAQVSLIQARRKRYEAAHPFFWAAFTLTGQ